MNKHSDEEPDLESQRKKIIGLGELSIRKSYYPELQQKHAELLNKNEELTAAYEELMAVEEELRENYDELSKKEQELRESEARLSSILRGSPVMQFVIDNNHEVISWNRAIEKYSGINAADIVGTDGHWRAFYPEKRPVLADILVDEAPQLLPAWYKDKFRKSRFLDEGYEVIDFFPNMGESGKWLHITTVPIRNPNGAVIGAIETLEDITKRRHAETELARVNRALRMLSYSDKALIHITDETTLMNEICRITVDVGSYRMAWIGFAEQDEAKTVRPVAHAGVDSGYIESARVSWADSERGRGPGGTAIRTGQPSIIRNISMDPAFTPWRVEAGVRGYQSIIALPLTSEGRTFGALGIYAGEADVFDSEEVEILKELADDLAFGITTLRTRAKREQAEEALKESEKFLNNVVENIPDMIFVKDARDLRFVRFNKAGEDLIGYMREDLYGKNDYDFFPKDEADFFTGKDREVLNKREPVDVPEEKIQTRLMGERILHTKKIPILDEAGNPGYLMGISEDITERRRTEEALKLARNKMNLLNAVTFQDIQTATFSLSAYHELMKTVVTDEKGKTFLAKQVSANKKILDSLNFAKNYQDMGIRPPKWQNIGQAFLFAISHLDFLQITRNFHVEGLEVYADSLLEKVFFHMMQNVLRHGIHATEVTVRYQEKPDELVLIIEDNGIGIPAEEKQMIFDRGYGKNTGLGLFFVREVLSITGIGIKETGEPGKGARFEIAVPKGGYRFTDTH